MFQLDSCIWWIMGLISYKINLKFFFFWKYHQNFSNPIDDIERLKWDLLDVYGLREVSLLQ